MSVIYSTGDNTYLRDAVSVPLNGTFPAVAFKGRPGVTMLVDTVTLAQAVSGGGCTVPESSQDIATLVAFDPPNAPQGLLKSTNAP